MKKTFVAFMCIVSLLILAACGGSPVDNALKKVDDSIEKLEKAQKKGDKLSREELEAMSKELEGPVEVLKKAVDNDEVSGITKLTIVAKLGKWAVLAATAGLQNVDLNDIKKETGKAAPDKEE